MYVCGTTRSVAFGLFACCLIHSFVHSFHFIHLVIHSGLDASFRFTSLHFRPVSCPVYKSNFMLPFFWLLVAAIVVVVAACAAAAAVTSCLSQRSSGTRTQAQSQFRFRLRFSPFFHVNLSGREGKGRENLLISGVRCGINYHDTLELSWQPPPPPPPQSQSVWTTSYANKTIDSKWNSEMQRFPTNKQKKQTKTTPLAEYLHETRRRDRRDQWNRKNI